MYYVRMSKQEMLGLGSVKYGHYTLPNWVKFHEKNFTFVIQPPSTQNVISVEV